MKQVNHTSENTFFLTKKSEDLARLTKAALMAIMMMFTVSGLYGQSTTYTTIISGGWDYAGYTNTTALEGYADKTSGVVQLANATIAGKDGAFVSETSSTYNPATTDFSQCYKVFFGCPPANDNIGGPDQGGDGMAFSFTLGSCSYNLTSGLSGGGGLGYMNACPLMITLEFDTYSSQGTNSPTYDKYYGGGTSGNNDEISLHFGGDASDNNIVTTTAATNTNAGNLEDGTEHNVCISYIRATHILSVTIDGISKFSYDLTGSPYDLSTYFGAGALLNQTWSAGKQGAVDIMIVSNGAGIFSTLGGSPCPSGVVITSPANGDVFTACPLAPITITATATPPVGFAVTSVDFKVDGVTIGTDNTAPYSYVYNPTIGNHVITATAHFTDGTNPTSTNTNITVGAGLNKTTTAPTIDGTAEALWNSYPPVSLTKGFNSAPSLAATYQLMYDATNIYVLVNVTDNTPNNPNLADAANYWKNDAVELFFDIGNTKTGSYGANHFHYGLDWNKGSILEANGKSIAGITTGQTNKASPLGYIMEYSIPWTTLGLGTAPGAGTYMGFDVNIDDNAAGGARTNQLGWNDATFTDWNNPSKFGTLQFANCNPLPVALIDFTAVKQGAGALVAWFTTNEQNSAYFIVEKSTNGTSFEPIGKVTAIGNSTSFLGYSFTDPSIASGVTYYRLAQYDINGTVYYSIIKTVVKDGLTGIHVVPNPNNGIFIVTLDNASEVKSRVTVLNALGQVVYTNESADNLRNVDISALASGIYYLQVSSNEATIAQKMIKE